METNFLPFCSLTFTLSKKLCLLGIEQISELLTILVSTLVSMYGLDSIDPGYTADIEYSLLTHVPLMNLV